MTFPNSFELFLLLLLVLYLLDPRSSEGWRATLASHAGGEARWFRRATLVTSPAGSDLYWQATLAASHGGGEPQWWQAAVAAPWSLYRAHRRVLPLLA